MERVGKIVAGSLYVHKSSVKDLDSDELKTLKHAIRQSKVRPKDWNVVRISNDNVALLNYQNFDDDPFPRLLGSVRVDLFDDQVSKRDYRASSNRPILHRKELLVTSNYPNRRLFERLTEALEHLGLFYDAHIIGYEEQWASRLKMHGVEVVGHEAIVHSQDSSSIKVQRHKSAMVRHQLSTPIQALIRAELLTHAESMFDYGCGRKNDVDSLIEAGFCAAGWDPYYFPGSKITAADVVNIGFVLNVIEDQEERREALRKAWALTKKVLAVAVISPNANSNYYARPYSDGFLTSIGTFQKFYTQEELRDFLSVETGADPVPVSSGVFFIFKDEIAEQKYLINRLSDKKQNIVLPTPKKPKRHTPTKRSQLEKLSPLLEHLRDEICRIGRPLKSNELTPELQQQLKSYRTSLETAQQLCLEYQIDIVELSEIFERRKRDILVFLSRQLFNRDRKYRKLPNQLKNDIRTAWGSYSNAESDARRLLFTIGDDETIWRLCEEAAAEGLGYILPDQQFQFHSSVIPRFPAPLRCYIACGTLLFGDLEFADLIKIHPFSAKLTLMSYDGFETNLPTLRKRVKINFSRQKTEIFDYEGEERRYLFLKSLFVPEDFPGFTEQEEFDREVLKLPGLDFSFYGPRADYFDAVWTSERHS